MIESTTNKVWEFFSEITKIPRRSKHEEQIRNYLVQFAKANYLNFTIDQAGNILIKKKGDKSSKTNAPIILQSHLDMVCEKDEKSTHNFDKDAILTYVDGEHLKAKGTTLGADNGIGIAMQLALLASTTISHPDIECLFTVDEETGLYGATNLDANMLSGKTLINLDTEEEGEFCIGCAGGTDTLAKINFEKEKTPDSSFFFEVKISGLQGGHSGEDINKGRGNAIKILTDYLSIIDSKTKLQIVDIHGGNLRNAIPREASAILCIPYPDKEMVRIEINHFIHDLENHFLKTEPKLRVDLESTDLQQYAMPRELTQKLIRALQECPHGVIEMNSENPNLVDTSTNLAAISTQPDYIEIETSQRSANENRKQAIAEKVAAIFASIGAEISRGKDYPGWEPNFNSDILEVSKNAYQKLYNKTPIVKTIHAGLECGVILKKHPNLDMISIGPTIENAHSPSEQVHIDSVRKCWDLLIEILQSA